MRSGSAAACASVELAHRDLDFHAGVVDLAKHLGHAAHRLRIQRRRLGQLDRDHLARGRIRDRVLRHHDVLAVALVFGRDEPDAAFMQQPADDRRLPALEDLEHAPFGSTFAVVADDPRLHAIAVQHRAHLLRREVQVGLAIVSNEKTVTVAVTLHRAFHFAHQVCADGRGILK